MYLREKVVSHAATSEGSGRCRRPERRAELRGRRQGGLRCPNGSSEPGARAELWPNHYNAPIGARNCRCSTGLCLAVRGAKTRSAAMSFGRGTRCPVAEGIGDFRMHLAQAAYGNKTVGALKLDVRDKLRNVPAKHIA